ncbi:SDR family NAD(P)-dependent oxidoreductase [Aromatoleum toluclasticum]|uniref:SDR family NAD(P)-dependent oxidoreductase n=1 Tax=Aromatoleum toluclasticum TaxID=92003 RepID=UPI00035F1055|nr:glucose 1-dehydrogenase [Aromatoleum toluclasticum]
MGRIEGKTAIVTGGARGMGEATVRRFVAEGGRVVIADVLDAEGRALADELGANALFAHLDVSDAAAWKACAAQAVDRFGGVDVLVNNAGICLVGTIVDFDPATFQKVLAVNLGGAFLGMQTVAPLMFARGKGSIINISSTEGLHGTNGMAAYGSSKWGLRGLTKVAAMEFGPRGVRVNSIHPGAVDTPMAGTDVVPAEVWERVFRRQPIQRIGRPEEVANVSLFLASDESTYLCGAEIAVDGGMTAGGFLEFAPGAPA